MNLIGQVNRIMDYLLVNIKPKDIPQEWQFEGENLFEVVLMSKDISKERSTEILDGERNGKVHSLRLQLLVQPFQLLRQSWWCPYELPCQTSNKIRSSLHGLIFIVAINVRNTNIITDNCLD